MARVRTRWKRQVLAWWTLAAAFLLQFALVGASGQGFDATPQVRCPLPQPIVKFSSGTSPTRAGFVQHWIRQLRTQVPAVAVPPVLASVPRNDFVALCFAPASGPATEGLGTNADMAIQVVSTSTTEEVARFDSKGFAVQFPGSGALIDDNTRLYEYPPGRGPFLAIPRTAGPDLALMTELNRSVFTIDDEVLAFGAGEDQPGRTRFDRMVLADRCGRVSLDVRVVAGVLGEVEVEGMRATRPCEGGRIRNVVTVKPTVTIDATSLILKSADRTITLRRSPVATPEIMTARQYTDGRRDITWATRVPIDRTEYQGGLRLVGGYFGCTSGSTSMAFSGNRFLIDPQALLTPVLCEPAIPPTAAVFLLNPSGRGTYVLQGRRLLLTFADGATAVLGLRRTPPID